MSSLNDCGAKIPKLAKVIGTHNGPFHCDEVLACSMLKCLPEYRNADIRRTRNPAELDKCDIVVDVGGVYDPEKLRFDHHQKTFHLSLRDIVPSADFKTRLSSAGLIYAHYGREVIANVLNMKENALLSGDHKNLLDILYIKCYEQFMEEIDANDNGVSQHDNSEEKFLITTTLSRRVGYLNPWWNSEERNEDACFYKAMDLVLAEFCDRLNYFYNCWWPARNVVKQAVENRFEVDASGAIISFDNGGCPWKEHVFELEKDLNINPIKYAIFPDNLNDAWSIACVPVALSSFTSRSPLPEAWRGLRDEQLSKIVGFENCIFCHATGFCGGHKTKEGALKMVRTAMKGV